MDSWLVFRSYRVILNQLTKRNDRSFKWFPKTSLIWGLPIRQEILNVSQISKAFHGICPPIFIQTWLQQYGRGAFFYSAHCSFSNPICFWSVWCSRAMMPGEIFTSFAEFQGIVSVNGFRLPIWLQELLQASSSFLWSFCFARICLVRGENLERRRTGCRPWGVGDDGRIGNLLKKTQCERGDVSQRKRIPIADGRIKPLEEIRTW